MGILEELLELEASDCKHCCGDNLTGEKRRRYESLIGEINELIHKPSMGTAFNGIQLDFERKSILVFVDSGLYDFDLSSLITHILKKDEYEKRLIDIKEHIPNLKELIMSITANSLDDNKEFSHRYQEEIFAYLDDILEKKL